MEDSERRKPFINDNQSYRLPPRPPVDEFTRHDFTDLRKMNWYWYFDSPDHADCLKKVAFVGQYSVLSSGMYTFYDAVQKKLPQTVSQLQYLAVKNMVPFTASMMLGSAVQCAVANLRGKRDDDLWSFVIGGAAIGLFWGMKWGCSGKGAGIAAAAAVAGFTTKALNMEGISLFPGWPDRRLGHWEISGLYGNKYGGDWRLGIWTFNEPGGRRNW